MKIFNKGDEVVIENGRSVNYGMTGKIVGIDYWVANGATHRVAIDGRREQNYSPISLRLKRTSKEIREVQQKVLPKPEYVLVYVSHDGEFDYNIDFSCEWWNDVIVSNDPDIIKEAIQDALDEWDYVYGVLNGEPFLAKREISCEGIDISKL